MTDVLLHLCGLTLKIFCTTGKSGVIFAVKLYPAGATTNSQDGVTDLFGKCLPVLEEMVEHNMPLLVNLLEYIVYQGKGFAYICEGWSFLELGMLMEDQLREHRLQMQGRKIRRKGGD